MTDTYYIGVTALRFVILNIRIEEMRHKNFITSKVTFIRRTPLVVLFGDYKEAYGLDIVGNVHHLDLLHLLFDFLYEMRNAQFEN